MLAVKCFIVVCVTYCQDLVADLGGGYRYSEPYIQQVDKQCIENQNK